MITDTLQYFSSFNTLPDQPVLSSGPSVTSHHSTMQDKEDNDIWQISLIDQYLPMISLNSLDLGENSHFQYNN